MVARCVLLRRLEGIADTYARLCVRTCGRGHVTVAAAESWPLVARVGNVFSRAVLLHVLHAPRRIDSWSSVENVMVSRLLHLLHMERLERGARYLITLTPCIRSHALTVHKQPPITPATPRSHPHPPLQYPHSDINM